MSSVPWGASVTPRTLRFRDFELDPAEFELRRAGHCIRLERKPMELLILLAEKRGQLVTRKEIIERIWGTDFFFDAERGINNAIRKIRAALNDDSELPRFVETIVGKGYRFIGPIEVPAIGSLGFVLCPSTRFFTQFGTYRTQLGPYLGVNP